MKKYKKPVIITAAVLVLAVITAAVLYFSGIIHINHPNLSGYEVRGVDVSKYQGEIDWELLASQNIDFAFIKATEGSSYVDEQFAYNLENAQKTDLRIGFYHFFSFESPGRTQADNFINNVPVLDNSLPPVIDVELYGKFRKEPLDKDIVIKELDDIITRFTEYYGQKPIIYTTGTAYNLYVKEDHSDCELWIRNVYSAPAAELNWSFWQYDARTRLKGYKGEEQFIDMNVFRGTKEDFGNYNTKPYTEEK